MGKNGKPLKRPHARKRRQARGARTSGSDKRTAGSDKRTAGRSPLKKAQGRERAPHAPQTTDQVRTREALVRLLEALQQAASDLDDGVSLLKRGPTKINKALPEEAAQMVPQEPQEGPGFRLSLRPCPSLASGSTSSSPHPTPDRRRTEQ